MKSSILRWKFTHHNIPWKQLTSQKKGSVLGWCPWMFYSDSWLLWPLSAAPAHLSRVGERVWCQGRILLNAHQCRHESHQRNVLQNPSHRLEGKPGIQSELNLKVFLLSFFLPLFLSLSFRHHSHTLSFFFSGIPIIYFAFLIIMIFPQFLDVLFIIFPYLILLLIHISLYISVCKISITLSSISLTVSSAM